MSPSETMEIDLPAVPSSISAARHAVAALLYSSAELPHRVIEDVLLLVSELVTNVVLHAGTDTQVTARVNDRRISVSVSDRDALHQPVLAGRGSRATSGRGIMLVDAISTSWGVELRAGGKVVWFEASYDPLEAGVARHGAR